MLFSMYANMLSFIQNAHHNGRQCRPELKSIDERGYFLRCTNTVFFGICTHQKRQGCSWIVWRTGCQTSSTQQNTLSEHQQCSCTSQCPFYRRIHRILHLARRCHRWLWHVGTKCCKYPTTPAACLQGRMTAALLPRWRHDLQKCTRATTEPFTTTQCNHLRNQISCMSLYPNISMMQQLWWEGTSVKV